MPFTFNPFTNNFDYTQTNIVPPGTVAALTGDSGGAVGPDITNNINIVGGPGIDVVGTPGTNTMTIILNGGIEGLGERQRRPDSAG